MKIVILEADCLGNDVSFDCIYKEGDVISYGVTAYEEIGERLKEADIALINRCRMEEETLKEVEKLKLVCIMGTGTDMIDVDYMKARGILVSNVRGYSTDSVAQHTFAMLFYLLEQLPYFDRYVKEGCYTMGEKQTYTQVQFTQIAGKTWGICGLGAIGLQVARIARTFGATVIYYSTSGKNTNDEFEQVGLEELLERSDILSIHAPLTQQSRGLFGYQEFQKMKSSAILINVGRGAILKEEDLVRALNENEIHGAALDVLIQEPMEKNNPLLTVTNPSKLLITPHIAWASREARQLVIEEMACNIREMKNGGSRNLIY